MVGMSKALDAAKIPGTHAVTSLPRAGGSVLTYVQEKLPGGPERAQQHRNIFTVTAASPACWRRGNEERRLG